MKIGKGVGTKDDRQIEEWTDGGREGKSWEIRKRGRGGKGGRTGQGPGQISPAEGRSLKRETYMCLCLSVCAPVCVCSWLTAVGQEW